MSIRSKSFILASVLVCSSAMAETPAPYELLLPEDLKNPERVMAHLKSVPKRQKPLAESLYQHAQRSTETRRLQTYGWGSVAKYSHGSLEVYPMAKTYLLGVEAELRHWAKNRVRDPSFEKKNPGRARERLQRAADWLDVAILVDAYERTLSDPQRKNIIFYRDCLRRYLETDKPEANCVPLLWSGEIPTTKTECPSFNGATSNVLVNARLFDGPVADQAELVPDNEQDATWNVGEYKLADRALVLVCEYKNHSQILAQVDYSANRCYFKGKKKRSAWCSE